MLAANSIHFFAFRNCHDAFTGLFLSFPRHGGAASEQTAGVAASDSVTLALKPGQKAQGASLDRFGLFTSTAGGQMVKIYLDDLTYTAARPAR